MSNTKHTPGRWHVDGYNTVAVISETIKEGLTQDWPQYQHVCTCDYGNGEPGKYLELNKANAKLIAAAPELLEAAQYAVECLDRMWNQFNNIGDDGDQAYQSLKAAIKKASE